jgi:hypothetical protein
LEFADGVETDEAATIEANKEFWVKDLLQGIESAANVVLLARGMNEDVVAVGFDPGDVVDRDKEGALTFADEQALGIAAIPLNLLEQMLQTRLGTCAVGACEMGTCTVEGFSEAILSNGLEEIVESVNLESAKSVLVVGGDEDDLRQLCGMCGMILGCRLGTRSWKRPRHLVRARICGEGLDDGKAVGDGHLDVEKDEIRVEFLDCGDGRVAAVRFPDYPHTGFGAQKAHDFPARWSFIVNNEDAELDLRCHESSGAAPAGTPSAEEAATRNGTRTVTSTPPAGRLLI